MKSLLFLLIFITQIGLVSADERKEGDVTIKVSAKLDGESVVFVIDPPTRKQGHVRISTPPDPYFENLIDANIEGAGLSIPLGRTAVALAVPDHRLAFKLPRSMVKGLKLKMRVSGGSGDREIDLEEIVTSAPAAKKPARQGVPSGGDKPSN